MQKVTCYKADDGTIFETEEEARIQDMKCSLNKIIMNDTEYCYGKVGISDANDLIHFIKRNEPTIRMILNALNPNKLRDSCADPCQ
jgi:hypothetical protein